MVFRIRLADQIIEIQSLCGTVYNISKDYIVPDDNGNLPDIVIKSRDEDIKEELYETQRTFAARNNGSKPPIMGEGYYESIAVFRKIADAMPRFNTFLMHGAVVAKDGQAFMFTADSGVGKTTRIKLWLDNYPDSFVVNGDKPLLKVSEDSVMACGTPWCGKEGWNRNVMVPLKAIFMLERADEGCNSIEEVNFGDAFPFLLQQTHCPDHAETTISTIRLLGALDGKIKVYRFRSLPAHEALRLAYETAVSGN